MFSSGHWAAGILGTIATIGWTLQGLGNAFYYRQVCPIPQHTVYRLTLAQIWSHHTAAGHTMDKASPLSHPEPAPTHLLSGKGRTRLPRRQGLLYARLILLY